MSRDIALLLIGAGIALGSSIITAVLKHLLDLRVEKKKTEWEKEERETLEFAKRLTEGSEIQLEALKSAYMSELIRTGKIHFEYQDITEASPAKLEAVNRLVDGVMERLKANRIIGQQGDGSKE